MLSRSLIYAEAAQKEIRKIAVHRTKAKENKEERYSRVPRLLDIRYSAKGTKGIWSSKTKLKCATYRR